MKILSKLVQALCHYSSITRCFRRHEWNENITGNVFFGSGVYSPDYDNCRNVLHANKHPRHLEKADFGSGRDLNHWPPLHDSSSGGDSVYHLSAIPRVSFRSNYFTICRPSPTLVQKMSIPGHGDSDSSGISTSTRLPDACITRPCLGPLLY